MPEADINCYPTHYMTGTYLIFIIIAAFEINKSYIANTP